MPGAHSQIKEIQLGYTFWSVQQPEPKQPFKTKLETWTVSGLRTTNLLYRPQSPPDLELDILSQGILDQVQKVPMPRF